ncbi:MAG: glucose 1-dehydrogenase [Solirubrobacteraceae bacterium]|nr:glucose 1-dehydrogenase [Solirubrobacteraceae bacterium]
MLAITVEPGVPGSAQLEQLDEPERRGDELLVEMIELGVCGTDLEIVIGRNLGGLVICRRCQEVLRPKHKTAPTKCERCNEAPHTPPPGSVSTGVADRSSTVSSHGGRGVGRAGSRRNVTPSIGRSPATSCRSSRFALRRPRVSAATHTPASSSRSAAASSIGRVTHPPARVAVTSLHTGQQAGGAQCTQYCVRSARQAHDVTEALIGLLGIGVGALISGGLQALSRRQDRRIAGRVAARLLHGQLWTTLQAFDRGMAEDRWWPARYAADLETWREKRLALATTLSAAEYVKVAGAFDRIDYSS